MNKKVSFSSCYDGLFCRTFLRIVSFSRLFPDVSIRLLILCIHVCLCCAKNKQISMQITHTWGYLFFYSPFYTEKIASFAERIFRTTNEQLHSISANVFDPLRRT